MADVVQKITDKHSVVVFSSSWCPYCRQVISALDGAGVSAFVVEVDAALKRALLQKTGKTSVPSVWIGDKYIGGCNDGPEGWMGTIPNLRNGKVQKWVSELEKSRGAGPAASIFNITTSTDETPAPAPAPTPAAEFSVAAAPTATSAAEALIKGWFPDASVESLKDPGTTGNFEVTVNGALVHSKKTGGHGFLHDNPAQQAVVKAAIEKAAN